MSKLVLTANIGEPIHIGDDVVITVVEINGKAARIAFEAPVDVEIDRAKIRARKVAERGDPK